MSSDMLQRIANGRTDLVHPYVDEGHVPGTKDAGGVSLLDWCAYYGDVSAIRFLLDKGEQLTSLGEDLGLNAAAFHGHWRLCAFLLEQGADANARHPGTNETPLHAALCTSDRAAHDRVIEVLLSHGADPNAATAPGAETGCFMRDARTRGETPLHRAAAFGSVETIRMLLSAGAQKEARDATGDTPLSWASWYLRPDDILRELLFGDHTIHPDHRSMPRNLQGEIGGS